MDLFKTILMMIFVQYITQITLGSSSEYFTKPTSNNVFDVTAYGAAGDAKTIDTQAFLNAWKAMCDATTDTPTLLIPAGKTFLLSTIAFQGPCKSNNPSIQILGNLIAVDRSSWGTMVGYWILFQHVDGLSISGTGQIDGRGDTWWNQQEVGRPLALQIMKCNGLTLQGLTYLNSPQKHIKLIKCQNVIISNLHITAPENSPNTDGINISKSKNIQIKDCFIGTGDDCVAIISGSSFVNITNVNCGPGHGISIGSLGARQHEGDVEEVHVTNCNLTRTQNGLRIKTWQGGSGYARKISFQQIRLESVYNPILIDQYYCLPVGTICKNQTSAVQVSDITFSGIEGTSIEDKVINLSCSESVACTNIAMKNVKIVSVAEQKKAYSYCLNAQGKSTDTSPDVSCLSKY